MEKVILITGGSSGLGYRTAGILADDNRVVILSRNKKELTKAARQLGCVGLVADVSDYRSVERAVAAVIKKYGRVDCLINSAGIWIQGELTANEPKAIAKVMEVNTLGTIFATRAVLPVMKKHKSGLIINVISQGGLYGKAERTVYSASKFAVTGFTKSLQPEAAKYGVRVTGFYPGLMRTELFKRAGYSHEMTEAMDPGEAAKILAFIVHSGQGVCFPEVGIKQVNN